MCTAACLTPDGRVRFLTKSTTRILKIHKSHVLKSCVKKKAFFWNHNHQKQLVSKTQFAPGVRLVPGAQLWVPQVTAVAELAPWVLTATCQALLASCHIGFAAKPSCGNM